MKHIHTLRLLALITALGLLLTGCLLPVSAEEESYTRWSAKGDTVTADGYHLKDSYGDYTAALTWFCTLTGKNAYSVTYRPAEIAAYFDEIAQSVNNAVATPLAVTECK